MVQVCEITLVEYRVLRLLGLPFLLLCNANYSMHTISCSRFIHSVLDLLKFSGTTVYVLISKGNDNVEDLFVDELLLNELPAMVSCRDEFSQIMLTLTIDSYSTRQNLIEWLNSNSTNVISQSFSITDLTAFLSGCPLRLFVAGDRSSVGKSSICLCLLVALLDSGIPASALSYIKPATQCEAEQPVTRLCQTTGIRTAPGPIVFYQGFTRAFLAGETLSSLALLDQAASTVASLAASTSIVLIDGVGYPSVGSICGVSNAVVARRLSSPVLLIGRPGVGDAADSHDLNASYFISHGCAVLGGVFNKLDPDPHGYYSVIACQEALTRHFTQSRPGERVYACLPRVRNDSDVSVTGSSVAAVLAREGLTQLYNVFRARIDLRVLLSDVFLTTLAARCVVPDTLYKPNEIFTEELQHQDYMAVRHIHPRHSDSRKGSPPTDHHIDLLTDRARMPPTTPYSGVRWIEGTTKRSREEVEAAARIAGATGG